MKRSYRVLARLGEGGMATVYLAMVGRPGGFRKLVALKVLRDAAGTDGQPLREAFAREARVSARCHHRNVVQILDVCELDGKPALCMEYLDGQTYRQLRARAVKSGLLPLFEQLRILAETAHGLHHVHTRRDYEGRPLGLVHCDVSPENVFVTYDGEVKLLDFGIAKQRGDQAGSEFRGKLSYLAPEVIRGDAVDARADVFALGAMLWEAICAVPFAGGPTIDDISKLRNRLTGAEGDIRRIQPSAPEALIDIVDRAIALDPAQRFANAEAFAIALEVYLQMSGAQPSAQSLARLIVPMFAREVATLRATIEPQLALAERWDSELDARTTPRPYSPTIGAGVRFSDPPDAPFDFALQEQTSLAPLSTTTPLFLRAADTVVPWYSRGEQLKRLAPMAALVLLGVIVGAALGLRRSTPTLIDNPASNAALAARPGSNAKSVPDEPSAASPHDTPADSPRHARDEAPSTATTQPCVDPPRAPVAEPQRSEREQRRARRHHERRLRRRAAQCAAGRLEKCLPIPEV